MTLGLSLDPSLVLLLAGLIVLDGTRTVPSNAVVFRRMLGGRWFVESSPVARRRSVVLAWWPPLISTVVVLPKAAAPEEAYFEHRWSRTSAYRCALSVNGGLILFCLLLAVPAAYSSLHSTRFILFLALPLALSILQAALVIHSLKRSIARYARKDLWLALSMAVPFTAPRAGNVLGERVLSCLGPVRVAQLLLSRTDLLVWLRPRIFDHVCGGQEDEELVECLGAEDFRAVISQEPDDCLWCCPRCGASFVVDVACCPDYGVVLAAKSSPTCGSA